MSLWSRWFPGTPPLDPAAAQRLAAWQALTPAGKTVRLDQNRFVVMDVETTGLSLTRDHLIAIGAVAVTEGRIDLDDSFEVVLQQETSSGKDNILIHGIGGTAQVGGLAPVEALLQFLEYLGRDPLVAFHVTFDETMTRRALKKNLGLNFRHTWLDLAYVAPALYPELARKYRALDDWVEHFHNQNFSRHNALADSLATAQLFLVTMETARQKNIEDLKGLIELEKAQRWVSRTE
ncbi:MAG: 3'-5' exonuclease [Sulfuricella sp.]